MELFETDTFAGVMRRAMAEYCQAYDHADFSYWVAQVPRPEFTRGMCFNWVPLGSRLEIPELAGSEQSITCSSVPFEHPMLKGLEVDYEPGVLLYDGEDDIVGYVYYPVDRLSAATMHRFARNFTNLIELLPSRPTANVHSIALIS
jgi:hypothetical protein